VKVAWIVLATAVALALQTTLARFVVRGTVAVDLVLVVVVYTALKAGPVTGLLTGTFAGLVQDALSYGVHRYRGPGEDDRRILAGVVGTQFIVRRVAAPIRRFFRSDNHPRRGIYRVCTCCSICRPFGHALFRGDWAGRRECRGRASWPFSWPSSCLARLSGAGLRERVTGGNSKVFYSLCCPTKIGSRVGIRLSVLQYVFVALFSVLAVSFWVLQVAQHAKFEEMAENNNQRTIPGARAARRGVRSQRSRARREPARLQHSIVREHTKDLNLTIRLLAQVLRLDPVGVKEIVDRHRREPTYRPIMIIQDASLAQVTAVKAHGLGTARRAHRARSRPGGISMPSQRICLATSVK